MNIIRGYKFDSKNVNYSELKKLDNGAKKIGIKYQNKPFFIQTPILYSPFGATIYDPNTTNKYTLELSLSGYDDEESNVYKFYNNLVKFDTNLLALAKTRSQELFGRKKMSDSILEAFYNNLVKFDKDKTTNEISKKYPPKFRIKIPPNCVVFDEKTKEKIDMTDTTFADIIQSGCQVKAVVYCSGIWISNKSFVCSWNAKMLSIIRSNKFDSYCLLNDSDNEEELDNIDDDLDKCHLDD